jgi:hypothetical protein
VNLIFIVHTAGPTFGSTVTDSFLFFFFNVFLQLKGKILWGSTGKQISLRLGHIDNRQALGS